ncbi:hypothetical protein DsansV1_C04g0049471 [Dioscorea sansibarensis]
MYQPSRLIYHQFAMINTSNYANMNTRICLKHIYIYIYIEREREREKERERGENRKHSAQLNFQQELSHRSSGSPLTYLENYELYCPY